MKLRPLCLAAILLALPAMRSSAQEPYDGFGGCVDSPENPTLVLATLAAGAYAVTQLRRKPR